MNNIQYAGVPKYKDSNGKFDDQSVQRYQQVFMQLRVVDYCRHVVLGPAPTDVPPVDFRRVRVRPRWLEFGMKLIKTERSVHVLKSASSFRGENRNN